MGRVSKGAEQREAKANKPPPIVKPKEMSIRQIARQIFSDDQKEICGWQNVGYPIVGIAGKYAHRAMVTQQYIKGVWRDIPILVPAQRPEIAVPAGADLGTKDDSVIELPVGVKKDEPDNKV